MRKMPVWAAWAAGMLATAGASGAESWNPTAALEQSVDGAPVTLTGRGCDIAGEPSCVSACETACDDGTLFARGGWESQVLDAAGIDSQVTGLSGGVLSLGITR